MNFCPSLMHAFVLTVMMAMMEMTIPPNEFGRWNWITPGQPCSYSTSKKWGSFGRAAKVRPRNYLLSFQIGSPGSPWIARGDPPMKCGSPHCCQWINLMPIHAKPLCGLHRIAHVLFRIACGSLGPSMREVRIAPTCTDKSKADPPDPPGSPEGIRP